MARVGDEIYFHAGGKPTSGKVVCRGRHGVTAKDATGQHHKIKWGNILGHKTRSTPAMTVREQGVDGAIVEDEHGRPVYIRGYQPEEPEEQEPKQEHGFDMLGKAMILFTKAGAIKNRPGLHLEDRTDRTGKHGKRWVYGQEAEKAPRRPAKDPEYVRGSKIGFGAHNLEAGDRVQFTKDGQPAEGEITAVGKDGATVKNDVGEHRVYWREVRGHKARRKPDADAAQSPAKNPVVLGKKEPIPAAEYVSQA
jgi:hypothetical protein